MLEEKDKKEIDRLIEEKDRINTRLEEINNSLEKIRLKEIASIMKMEKGNFYLYRIERIDGFTNVYFQWTDKCEVTYDSKFNAFHLKIDLAYFENLITPEFSVMTWNLSITPDCVMEHLHSISESAFKERLIAFKKFITTRFKL